MNFRSSGLYLRNLVAIRSTSAVRFKKRSVDSTKCTKTTDYKRMFQTIMLETGTQL